jgi:hypothetical protein
MSASVAQNFTICFNISPSPAQQGKGMHPRDPAHVGNVQGARLKIWHSDCTALEYKNEGGRANSLLSLHTQHPHNII